MPTLHKSLTRDRINEAAERALSSLDNPGFCLSCGAETDGCEPDAENYECEACGEHEVFGAQEILIRFFA